MIGLWPANSEGDDILIFADEARSTPIAVLAHAAPAIAAPRRPRQCRARRFRRAARQRTCRLYRRLRRHRRDRRAGGGRALQARQRRLFGDHGQGAGRPAGRGARRKPARSAYAANFGATRPTRTLSAGDLIAEKYRGIRPAPGYPAQPDHSEKATLFKLLDGERQIGVRLTESFAMWPGASVCGLYFSHPDSYYFGVGKIERDQVEDYARAQGLDARTAERWLAPILNYDPLAACAAPRSKKQNTGAQCSGVFISAAGWTRRP